MIDGKREWVIFSGIDDDHDETGAEFEKTRPKDVTIGRVGLATAHLMVQRSLVDFAVAHFEQTRK